MYHRSTSLSTQGVWVFITLALVLQLTTATPAQRPFISHHLNKRSFFDIQCKGVYDKSIFARLDRICEDCYDLFREPQLHSLCKSQCFSTQYFMGCVDVLLLTDECTTIIKMIEFLRGSPLNINSSCTIKKPTKEDIRRNPFQSSPY